MFTYLLQTVHSLTKYETPLVNLSPHPSLTGVGFLQLGFMLDLEDKEGK
jgi:hypothetical protein